ncbi:MAG: pitrilysin family protein, partial [Planctomycetia bacterium]|nr:pitrilysin family protein [Planctomycetia bacterium]
MNLRIGMILTMGLGTILLPGASGTAQNFSADSSAHGRIPELPFTKYTLDNGLDVILHEDHTIPVVAVNIWYRASSANEKPGRTGFAHLFEHLMFNGSEHWNSDYFVPIQEAGGQVNGSTSQERTNYWENVPSSYLERALWMESDRMGWLLPAMTREKLDTQRDVVRNERRQSYENRPYGLVYETILASIYPPEHPYSWPTIGSMEDLQRATMDDIADFFRRFYHPANASLCIAGDFDPAEARRLVEKYFAVIPAGPHVEPLKPWTVPLAEPKRIRMTDRVGLPALIMVWPTVQAYSDEEAALDLGANILGGDDTSRLYRKLVREKQLATSVTVGHNNGQLAGMMIVYIMARPDADLTEIEKIVREEIERISTQIPSTEEIERTLNRYETDVIGSLEPVGGFGGRADMFNRYNVQCGDPGYLANDVRRYLDVTPEQIRGTMAKYLGRADLVLTVHPCEPGAEPVIEPDPRIPAAIAREKMATGEHATAVENVRIPVDEDRRNLPGPSAQPAFDLPTFQRETLPGGMKVLLVERHKLPLVEVSLYFPYGSATVP